MISNRTKPRAYMRWSDNERQELERLVFEENRTFLEIERIMGRSSEALRLQLGTMIEQIDWSSVTPQVPAAVNPSPDDIANDILVMIQAGSSPVDIMQKYPYFYIVEFQGIISLWEGINRRPWRSNR